MKKGSVIGALNYISFCNPRPEIPQIHSSEFRIRRADLVLLIAVGVCVCARHLRLQFPLCGWCRDTVTVRGEYKTSKLAFLPGVLACITPLTASPPSCE